MLLHILISLTAILLTLLLIIGIHEFGHFLIARLLGIKVLRFSIGFGKTLWRRYDKKGTEYVLAAIPMGGYVKLLDETEAPVAAHELHLAFNHQPYYKKFLVVAAGPLANFILAFGLYWILFVIGFTSVLPVIGKVTPHSIAADAGIKPQAQIISVNHIPTHSWMGVIIRLLSYSDNTNHLAIVTQSIDHQTTQEYQLDLTHWHMDSLKPDPLESLGIQPYEPEIPLIKWPAHLLRNNQYGLLAALPHAWQNTSDFIYLNFIVIEKLFTGKMSLKSLGGPLFIFQSAGATLNQGITSFLSFIAFLSIAIGTINIFPIPGLDGGHLLFQTIEVILRRPIPPRILELSYRLGFILLLLLIFQSIVNDILRLY